MNEHLQIPSLVANVYYPSVEEAPLAPTFGVLCSMRYRYKLPHGSSVWSHFKNQMRNCIFKQVWIEMSAGELLVFDKTKEMQRYLRRSNRNLPRKLWSLKFAKTALRHKTMNKYYLTLTLASSEKVVFRFVTSEQLNTWKMAIETQIMLCGK